MTLQISQGRDQEDTANCSVFKKRFGANATTRNMIDLVLVIVILVLLGVAAPVIRGRCHGKLLLQTLLNLIILVPFML